MELLFGTHGLSATFCLSEANAEGWMICRVRVVVPGFGGEYRCNVHLDDLKGFRQDLEGAESSVGQPAAIGFSSLEPGLEIRMEVTRLGQIQGRYAFGSVHEGPVLSGEFSADQTYLRDWLKQV